VVVHSVGQLSLCCAEHRDCVHMMPHLLCVCLEDVLLCVHNVAGLLPHCFNHLGVAVACGCGADACRTANAGPQAGSHVDVTAVVEFRSRHTSCSLEKDS
jgi:hypothetical protein